MITERIEPFVRGESSTEFDSLALEAFAFQFERITPYRALCERQDRTPDRVTDWREVPLVPTRAYRTMELSAAPPVETFRSSGTTSDARSVHGHPFPDLYRATIEAAFPDSCLPPPGRDVPMLSLVPSREQLPDSSLSFMVDHVVDTWGDPVSAYAVGARGVDGRVLRSWLAGRQRDGRPCLLLATSFALVEALESLERLGLRFRLPPGSALFETGGTKGRSRELAPAELEAALAERLGLPAERIVREYGMTELTSQLYTASLHGGPRDLYRAPPWVRVRVLDPKTLGEAEDSQTGLVALFDLANVGSAIHLLTEDLGVLEPNGLRLVGRARGADLRGCSLTAEELARAT